MLIDTSYFIKEISLPNTDNKINSYNNLIEMYEREVLQNLLGYELYKEFTEALASPDPLPQKFIDLRDGVEFQFNFNGRQIAAKWPGLVNTQKESLIAYYCYFKIRQQELSVTSGVGEVRGKVENSEHVSAVRKMHNAWKRFLDHYGSIHYSEGGYKLSYWPIYLFYKYSDTYDTYNDLPSAYNFLNSRKATDFQNWVFEPYGERNRFGL